MKMLKLVAALSVALVSLASTPTMSSAQDVELRLGPDGVRPVIRDRDRDRD